MDLEQKIMDLKLIINQKGKYERRKKEISDEYNALIKESEGLKELVLKEEKDVKRLETISFSSIWFSILGRKNERIYKEKEEFSKAEYDYKRQLTNIENLRNEINSVNDKLKEIRMKEAELEELYKEKESIILEQESLHSEQLRTLNDKIQHIRSQNKEIREAISAGNVLVSTMNDILKSLNKAKNWGTYDIFGGGFIADMVKHSNLDDANLNIERLKSQATRFTRELKDVNLSMNVNIDISSTLRFADWFFDGFIFDLTVQSRIVDSIYKVEHQLGAVNHILHKLGNNLASHERDLNILYSEKNEILKK